MHKINIEIGKEELCVDYDKKYKEKLIENIHELKEQINNIEKHRSLVTKIERFSLKYGFDYQDVVDKIRKEPMVAAHFVKDPSKQSIHQKIASEYIKGINSVFNFEVLPSGGERSLYVDEGDVVQNKERSKHKTKSIDFKWEVVTKDNKVITVYATHKYTKEGGGAQDNQYNDVKEFHTQARSCINPNIRFISITDGEYYKQVIKRENIGDYNRVDYLNLEYKGTYNYAITIEKLESYIEQLIKGEI